MLIYLTPCSLDGFLEGLDGDFGWSDADEEVHSFFNDFLRRIGTYLYGRRMYEVMAVWETEPSLAEESPVMADFAAVWRDADKVVYSRMLEAPVTARTRIERELEPAAIERLKAASSPDLAIGGPDVASQAIRAGLVDEIHLGGVPRTGRLVGSGRCRPMSTLELDLVAQRTFAASGVVSLR